MAESGDEGGGLKPTILFLLILGALGIFWVFTGGPDRLSAQSGPFIRPPAPLGTGETYYLSGTDRWRNISFGSFGERSRLASNDGQPNTDPLTYKQERVVESELAKIQRKIDGLADDVEYQATFGTPSPYRGKITFTPDSARGAKKTTNKTEYVTITASSKNTAPIPITGWTLVSAIPRNDGSVSKAQIGNASSLPIVGEVNPVYGVQLEPGGKAYVVTGASPFGISFKTNICSGYISQFQEYSPKLDLSCPKPINELLFAKQKIPYLNACDEYVRKLPACKAVFASTPSEYGTECDQFIKNELTYNGCVDNHKLRPQFYTKEWRIFLNKQNELWRNKRDIIKLLDSEGKTVDMISY